jgi:hypothetical protein
MEKCKKEEGKDKYGVCEVGYGLERSGRKGMRKDVQE